MNKKMTVAVDIDDVLYPFSEFFIKYASNRLGVKKRLSDMTDYKVETLFSISNYEAIELIKDFMTLTANRPYLPPIRSSVAGIKALSREFDLQIVTARLDIYADQTQVWIDRYFSNKFSAIHYCGITDFEAIKISKLDKCQEIDAIMLIDDNVGNIANVMSGNIQGVLFGEYPWHYELDKYPKCDPMKVKNWDTVINAVKSYSNYIKV